MAVLQSLALKLREEDGGLQLDTLIQHFQGLHDHSASLDFQRRLSDERHGQNSVCALSRSKQSDQIHEVISRSFKVIRRMI